jgi:hypothetical protein
LFFVLFLQFAGVLMFNAMHLGPWTAWAGFWATAMPFFMAHWEEYEIHLWSLL